MRTGPLLRWLASLHKIKKTLAMAGAGLRRRSRLVTFLGASLVFATFVCKEVLLEHQKSIVEQADSAQRTFVILKRLDLLTARVTAIEAATDAARIHQRDLALMIRLSRASSDIKAYAESFEGLISEVKKAPIDRDRAKRIVTQAQQMDSDLDELNHAARRSTRQLTTGAIGLMPYSTDSSDSSTWCASSRQSCLNGFGMRSSKPNGSRGI
jgi:hypothetical protein